VTSKNIEEKTADDIRGFILLYTAKMRRRITVGLLGGLGGGRFGFAAVGHTEIGLAMLTLD
jgi:hypothetical protein